MSATVPVSVHDAITQPARLPPELPLGMLAPTAPEPGVPSTRAKSLSVAPVMDELDTGWDMGDEDPTASADAASPPSSAEMAGDGSVEGDGLDQVD